MSTEMSNETGTKPVFQLKSALKVRGQSLLLVGLAVLLTIVAIGGYAFHWTWTGFQGNTHWDWLKLLILPVVLSSAKLSFKDHHKAWFRIVIGASLFLLVTAIGGYAFHWAWTGFQGNTLWDWITLLLLPLALVAARLSYHSSKTPVSTPITTVKKDQPVTPASPEPPASVEPTPSAAPLVQPQDTDA